jgi:FixJ family two-component response regulator
MRRNLSGKEGGMSAVKTFTVFVVDDDDSVRMSLKRLLKACGYRVRTFESAEDFLASDRVQTEGCLVLDIRLNGMSGLDLHDKLASSEANYPVIFITAYEDPQWRERAAEMGAVAYLRKPFDEQPLLDALNAACRRLEEVRTGRVEEKEFRKWV